MLHRASRFCNIVQKVGLKLSQLIFTCFLTSKSTMLLGSQLLYLDGCLLNDHSTAVLSRPISNASGSTRGPSHVKRTLYIVFERGRRALRKFSLVCSQKTKMRVYFCKKGAIRARVFNLDKNDKIVFLQHGFVRFLLNFAHGLLLHGSDINSNRTGEEESTLKFRSRRLCSHYHLRYA